MSGDRRIVALALGLAMCSGPLIAADEEEPDTEFLEYLGMWEDSDEDWLILEKTTKTAKEKGDDPEPPGEKSMEKDDER
jgi:hypothetical protein